ncbi:hypothetical protein CLLI_22570 [Clostridium liquoris]|jgi:uncharacterized C2H2 Zn-finger protein/citrate lyase gamma subunit|uniref:SbsA Ig-like domain-containing protein n=1 Tax=Clostridium liquoris TaxID=1289519 RepID=A0A2T0B1K6_9CLOT|nr:hypothetical protein [Clostridium liquoris]PRR77693.1 hypothetical protein CLLI_22570 [Clostridium liquoris]
MVDEGKTLVNVVKVNFIDEVKNTNHTIETSDEIDIEPIKSEGKRDILRVKNRIYGINETEDIVIGYTLKFKDNLFNMQTMALVDGGTIEGDKYCGIEAGVVAERHPFTVEIFTEEKDYSRTVGYAKFTYKHCKGKPAKYKVKDGAFLLPEYEAESIPFRGEKPVEIEFINTLPTDPIPTTPEMKVDGGTVTNSNEDVSVEITSNVKWTFGKAINQDDVTANNFVVKKKSDGSVVNGNVTIDDTKKIVTFIPISIEEFVTYIAEAKAVNLLDGSGTTTPISVEFTTI